MCQRRVGARPTCFALTVFRASMLVLSTCAVADRCLPTGRGRSSTSVCVGAPKRPELCPVMISRNLILFPFELAVLVTYNCSTSS